MGKQSKKVASCLQARKGPSWKLPLWNLDLGLTASRTVRRQMLVIKAPQCTASFVAFLICKCTVLDLWRMAPQRHHTQPKVHEIHSNCVGYVNNLVLLVACESSNWLLQKLQFSLGVLEMDMECLRSLFSFKNSSGDFFSASWIQELMWLTAGRWLSGHGAWYARTRSIRTWMCTLGVLWKLRYGYVQPEPQCFGGGVVTGASERLAS